MSKIKLKDSKLLDENKKPIAFYHATPFQGRITSFFPLSHFGTKRAAEIRALHFTYKALGIPEPEDFLDNYSFVKQEKKLENFQYPKITIYDVFLAVKRPLKIHDFGCHSLAQYCSWFLYMYKPKSQFLSGSERCEGDVVGPNKIKYKKHLTDFIFVDPFTRSEKDLKNELRAESLYNDSKDLKNKPDLLPSFLHSVRSQVNPDNFSLAQKVAFQRMIRFLEGEGYDAFSYLNDYEDKGKSSYIIFRPQQVFIDQKTGVEHIIPDVNSKLLQENENAFFLQRGILSPSQRIQKSKQFGYSTYLKRQCR